MKAKLPPLVKETDLRAITRDAGRALTTVSIFEDSCGRSQKHPWLQLGESRVRPTWDRPDGRWVLDAYLPAGVTDQEHSSAYALRLPLVGLSYIGTLYQQTELTAWVDPNAPHDFHVPRPGYDPMKHPKAERCVQGSCKAEPHVIVPEGFYVPPIDLTLYELVRGKRVEILIGLVNPG